MASTNQSAASGGRRKYTRYTKAHLTHRNIRFWLVYLVLIALIVFGLMKVHAYFAEKLVEYEDSYYTHVAEEVFKTFSEKRFDELFRYEDMSGFALEGEKEYVAYLEKAVGGKEIDYTEIAPKKANEKRFLVTVDDKSFAEFTLKRVVDPEKSTQDATAYKDYTFFVIPITNSYPWGHELYEFDTIYINSKNPLLYDYYIPSYAEISVNGVKLNDEAETYDTGEDEKFFFDGHLPKGVDGFTLKHYSFECALGDPVVSVTDAEGAVLPLNDLGEGVYRFEYAYSDDELKDEFEAKALEFLKNWCLYSSHNTKKASVTDLCITGSRALSFINNYESYWITKADKQSFANERSWNYTMIDDQVLCCDVSCNYITVTKGKTNDYDMHLRLYLYRDKGAWKVYDFEMVNDSSNS